MTLVGECVIWTGATDSHGHGEKRVNGKMRSTHVLAYEEKYGPVPPGLVLDHLCRNRACRNADHLEPVTVRENTLRGEGLTAQFARRDACINGHPYTAENTRIRKSRGHARVCRQCDREFQKLKRSRIPDALWIREFPA